MSDGSKAVFLSYASQDAEAAKRICEALRAAGVEVWFDQSELVGGDQWDTKIRGQISSCALFMPVVSANTQARREGYFRIEWRLAAQRTHAMADGTPFLLPIVIDETRDADALVPVEFKAVQWTRLAAGEAAEQFAVRVHRILQGTVGRVEAAGESLHSARSADPVAGSAERRSAGRAPTALRSGKWFWPAVVTIGASVALVAGTVFWWARSSGPVAAEAEIGVGPSTKNGTAVTLERIRSTLDQIDVTRAELDLAGEFLTRAAAADATNAEIFAAWTLVDCRYLEEYYDVSPERKEALRQHARRAQSLDGNAAAVKFARAISMGRLASDPATLTEARALFVGLLTAMPRNPNVPRQLAWNAWARGEPAEAFTWLQRAEALGDAHGSSAFQRALLCAFSGRYAEALQSLDTAIGRQRAVKYLLWKSYLQVIWLGDAAAARRTLAEVPAEYLVEDMPASAKYFVEIRARDYAAALATVRTVPRAYMASGAGAFSTGYYSGWALHLLGREAGAQSEWRSSLGPVEKLLQEQPNDWDLLLNRALLLSSLGEKAAATQVWKTAQELYGEQRNWLEEYLAATQLTTDEAIARLERRYREHSSWVTAAELRLSPYYDRLREDPRFVALQARADADPRCSPTASARGDAGPVTNAPSAPPEKSVAVLPFANMSAEQDSAYFSDGIHEDILTNLSNIRSLHVVSRTSVMRYRDTTKTLPQIAKELGVAYILEGSVRRAGNKVRVTGQLIRAATDDHIWAKAYDRDLSDIFAIQSELAQAIAAELKAAISPAEIAEIARRPTENLEAYNLVLAARGIINRQGANLDEERSRQAIQLLQRAVEIDPGFARAWALLAVAHSAMIDLSPDRSAAPEQMAWAALEQAAKLAPDSREVHTARAAIFYDSQDYARAYEENEWVLARYPQDADAMRVKGFIQRRWGRWADALLTLRRALELDPTNIISAQNVALHYFDMRRYDEARAAYQRLGDLRPEELDNWRLPAGLATLDFLVRGSTVEGDGFFAALSAAERDSKAMIARRKNWALLKGDLAGFEALETTSPDGDGYGIALAEAMLIRGVDHATVNARLAGVIEKLRADVRREPTNENKGMVLARAEALAGEREAAVRDALKAVELLPISRDAFFGGRLRYQLGVVYAWAGDRDRAIEELTARLRTPPAVSTYFVRKSPDWWPLRDDPRFKALVDDPQNNAPLF